MGDDSTLVTVGPDRLEETRATSVYLGDSILRTVDPLGGRDDAKRLTAAALDADGDETPDIYAGYKFDTRPAT